MNSRNQLLIYIPVLLAMVFWSFSFIWCKQVFIYYDPVTLIVFVWEWPEPMYLST
jgi:drug/metabolite transporter (DMT)-like permease